MSDPACGFRMNKLNARETMKVRDKNMMNAWNSTNPAADTAVSRISANRERIDLHTHTTCSDGADDPKTLLEKAQKLGLKTISITDHNSVAAYDDPVMAGRLKIYDGQIIPGVEITCMFEGEVVEVLGYGFDLQKMKQELRDHVLSFEDKQNKEASLIRQTLEHSHAVFDPQKIVFDPKKESCRNAVLKELIRHPENDRLFLDPLSRTKSRIFTRREIYNPHSPLYTDESSLYPTVSQAVRMIHEAGGIALLAHLYEYASADDLFSRMDEIIQENGLDGLECRHSCFTPEDSERLISYCDQRHLKKSGGSDYHGSRKPDVVLGGKTDMRIYKDMIQDWPEDIRALNFPFSLKRYEQATMKSPACRNESKE